MSRHRWQGPLAGGEDDGVAWEGYVCERCGRVVKRAVRDSSVYAWVESYLGTWAKPEEPLPECEGDEPAPTVRARIVRT